MYLIDEFFRGILVVLFALENIQKEILNCTSSFIGSLVVFKNSNTCSCLTNVAEVFW